MDDSAPRSFSRRRIESLAEDLLARAGVIGVLPTPTAAIEEAVGVCERIDISKLPEDLLAKRPEGWQHILGAVMLPERAIFIDGSQPLARRRFTEAHEVAHLMCSWHETVLRLDTERTLFHANQDQIEAEANYGASYLLFQGDRFHQRALAEGPSIVVPLGLAREYGASMHSTMHFYVENHPAAVALLVAGRYPDAGGKLPIWRTVESPLFLQRFGPLTTQLVTGSTATVQALGEILTASRRSSEPPSVDVSLVEEHSETSSFRAEAFYNRRCHFVLLAEVPRVHVPARWRITLPAVG